MLDDLLETLRGGEQTRDQSRPQRADGGVLAGQSGSVTLADAIEPDDSRLSDIFGGSDAAAVGRQHLDRQFDLERDEVADLIAEYRDAGIGPTQFAASQGLVTDLLVEAAFDRLRDELDAGDREVVDAVEADLQSHLDAAQQVTESGISAYDGSESTATSATDSGPAIDYHDVLHRIGTPLFVLDKDGEILSWNRSLEGLTGVSEAEAQEMEMASMAFYPDGRRGKTLADKVLDAPENTDEKYDVPRVEDEEFTLYRDTSVMQDQYGDERHISFSAAPIYDDDGELVAVVEMVQDRTEDARRHESVTALVEEVKQTMQAMESGRLDARATFDDTEYVDEALLDVVDSLNEMARQFEELTERVDERTVELASTIDQTASAAATVEERVAEQSKSLTTAAENVQDVSAGMQQVAATSSEVASAAQRAIEAADQGAQANEAVQKVTDGLTDTSEDLVESVTDLEDQMDEVSEIVDVIADVAEQTNMLALNANIEAARAGESGSGFAVVADEVKSLANETSEHAAEISDSIDSIQAQATETADMVDTSHEQVERAEEEIQEALDALDEISDAVEAATSGIQEVADANDDQASNIEDITTMIEDAQAHAKEAEAATDEIVTATDQQTAAVDELVDSVEALSDSNR